MVDTSYFFRKKLNVVSSIANKTESENNGKDTYNNSYQHLQSSLEDKKFSPADTLLAAAKEVETLEKKTASDTISGS